MFYLSASLSPCKFIRSQKKDIRSNINIVNNNSNMATGGIIMKSMPESTTVIIMQLMLLWSVPCRLGLLLSLSVLVSSICNLFYFLSFLNTNFNHTRCQF